MGTSNRDRRAAKQRRRDQRRGAPVGASTAADVGRGLPARTLRALLWRTATDLADGRPGAEGDLRDLLAEHLARRRTELLSVCDELLVETEPFATGAADGVPPGLIAAHGRSLHPVSSWANGSGVTTEDATLATVRLLAALTA